MVNNCEKYQQHIHRIYYKIITDDGIFEILLTVIQRIINILFQKVIKQHFRFFDTTVLTPVTWHLFGITKTNPIKHNFQRRKYEESRRNILRTRFPLTRGNLLLSCLECRCLENKDSAYFSCVLQLHAHHNVDNLCFVAIWQYSKYYYNSSI